MKTIKTKLFCIFMVLMISLVLGGIILNSVFLESYYIYKNKGVLVSVSQKIKDEYMEAEKIIINMQTQYKVLITLIQ